MWHVVVRALVFVLGLVILLDALIDEPSEGLMVLIGLLLMGVISVDQLRALIARRENGDRGGGGERAGEPPPPGPHV